MFGSGSANVIGSVCINTFAIDRLVSRCSVRSLPVHDRAYQFFCDIVPNAEFSTASSNSDLQTMPT